MNIVLEQGVTCKSVPLFYKNKIKQKETRQKKEVVEEVCLYRISSKKPW
jgi:hypothetical protein